MPTNTAPLVVHALHDQLVSSEPARPLLVHKAGCGSLGLVLFLLQVLPNRIKLIKHGSGLAPQSQPTRLLRRCFAIMESKRCHLPGHSVVVSGCNRLGSNAAVVESGRSCCVAVLSLATTCTSCSPSRPRLDTASIRLYRFSVSSSSVLLTRSFEGEGYGHC